MEARRSGSGVPRLRAVRAPAQRPELGTNAGLAGVSVRAEARALGGAEECHAVREGGAVPSGDGAGAGSHGQALRRVRVSCRGLVLGKYMPAKPPRSG